MSLSAQDIIAVMEKAKELGFSQLEVEGLKLGGPSSSATVKEETTKSQLKESVPELKAEDIITPLSVLDEYDEDEIKYWSTPYGEALTAQREARDAQRKFEQEVRS